MCARRPCALQQHHEGLVRHRAVPEPVERTMKRLTRMTRRGAVRISRLVGSGSDEAACMSARR
jgi:hypothetical protein